MQIVGHQYARHPAGARGRSKRGEAFLKVRSRDGVQRTERFVEEHQRRARGQRSGNGDALSLSAGELARPPGGEPLRLEADQTQNLIGAAGSVRRGRQQSGHELDVPAHPPVRKKPAILRHITDAPTQRDRIQRRSVSPGDVHAPCIRLDQSIEAAQERGLARPALADQGKALSASDLQTHSVERNGLAEALYDFVRRESYCSDRVLSQSGRATQASKSRPLHVDFAFCMTLRCTATGYDWQSGVFVPRTQPL